MKKVCIKCKENKPLEDFYKQKKNKDGHRGDCKKCNIIASSIRSKKNIERTREVKRKSYHKNKEKYKITTKNRLKNKDEMEKKKKYDSNHKKKNRAHYNSKEAKRRASKKQATPKWADLEKIERLYIECKKLEELTGMQYHVDHIVPLKNDNVCGLHVWYNLQILEASLNFKKKNKFLIKGEI